MSIGTLTQAPLDEKAIQARAAELAATSGVDAALALALRVTSDARRLQELINQAEGLLGLNQSSFAPPSDVVRGSRHGRNGMIVGPDGPQSGVRPMTPAEAALSEAALERQARYAHCGNRNHQPAGRTAGNAIVRGTGRPKGEKKR